MKFQKTVAALDIGTNTIYAVIASGDDKQQLCLHGTGAADSHGVKNGIVIDIDRVVDASVTAIEEAEDAASMNIDHVYCNLNGVHLVGMNNTAKYSLSQNGKEVHERDVHRAVVLAQNISLPDNREIVHVILNDFNVDGMSGVKNPIGMMADVLEARVHIITGASNAVQNLAKAVQKSDVDIDEFVCGAFAGADLVCSGEEKEIGAMVINIGGGTVSIVIYHDGMLIYSEVLPFGGDDLTKLIAEHFHITHMMAEDAKRKHTSVMLNRIPETETLSFHIHQRTEPTICNKLEFCRIAHQWADDVFTKIKVKLDSLGLTQTLGAGIILTGGGALIHGLKEFVSEKFHSYVRLGSGRDIIGLDTIVRNPCYSTVIGTAQYGLDQQLGRSRFIYRPKKGFRRMQEFITHWFRDLF